MSASIVDMFPMRIPNTAHNSAAECTTLPRLLLLCSAPAYLGRHPCQPRHAEPAIKLGTTVYPPIIVPGVLSSLPPPPPISKCHYQSNPSAFLSSNPAVPALRCPIQRNGPTPQSSHAQRLHTDCTPGLQHVLAVCCVSCVMMNHARHVCMCAADAPSLSERLIGRIQVVPTERWNDATTASLPSSPDT